MASIAGVDQIGAPEGPYISTPAELLRPSGLASSIVCAIHSTLPVAASTAETAPWSLQHSYLGSCARATSSTEIGTISLPPNTIGAPVMVASFEWRGSVVQISSPVAGSSARSVPS